MSLLSMLTRRFRIRNSCIRETLAEFLGTLVLVALGDAANAQSTLSRTEAGTFLSVDLAWGFAVAMGVFVSGGVSGGHINPAVTVALALLGKFPWRKVPLFMIAQYIGAFAGSAIVYGVYLGNAIGDQVTGTAILVAIILAITDSRNMGTAKGMVPLMIGVGVACIGMSYGYNCGFPLNPARDLGPRLFTAVAGWGNMVFCGVSGDFCYWWIPIVAPHVGAILGAVIYWCVIELHWPDDEDEGLNGPVAVKTDFGSDRAAVAPGDHLH
ncbi:Aquaporin-10 [Chamberlinius hualienensis]